MTKGYAVDARGLTRRFGAFTAVSDLSLRVRAGTIFGFVGPSGSGKTTAIRMLCGLLKPTEGSAVVAGCDLRTGSRRLRDRLGYMAQRFSLYPDLTARENLEFYGGVYGLSGARLPEAVERSAALLDLAPHFNTASGSLSVGWRQRLALAAALIHSPVLLVLDEATSGVDPASRRRVWDVIDDEAARGTTVLVSTHYLEEAERCDQVAVMHGGRVVATGTPAALRAAYEGILYSVEVEPLIPALDVVRGLAEVLDATLFGARLHATLGSTDAGRMRNALEGAGYRVGHVEPISPGLEDVFVQAVSRPQPQTDVTSRIDVNDRE